MKQLVMERNASNFFEFILGRVNTDFQD